MSAPAARCGWIGRALARLQSLERAVAVAAILAAALALIADLVGRELLGQGIFGAQRAAVHLTFIAGMFGFVLAVGSGAHLRVKAADAAVPMHWRASVDRLGSLTSMALLLALAWTSAQFVLETQAIGERSPTLGIPIWPIQALMPYAFFSAALRYLGYAIKPGLKPAGGPAT